MNVTKKYMEKEAKIMGKSNSKEIAEVKRFAKGKLIELGKTRQELLTKNKKQFEKDFKSSRHLSVAEKHMKEAEKLLKKASNGNEISTLVRTDKMRYLNWGYDRKISQSINDDYNSKVAQVENLRNDCESALLMDLGYDHKKFIAKMKKVR